MVWSFVSLCPSFASVRNRSVLMLVGILGKSTLRNWWYRFRYVFECRSAYM